MFHGQIQFIHLCVCTSHSPSCFFQELTRLYPFPNSLDWPPFFIAWLMPQSQQRPWKSALCSPGFIGFFLCMCTFFPCKESIPTLVGSNCSPGRVDVLIDWCFFPIHFLAAVWDWISLNSWIPCKKCNNYANDPFLLTNEVSVVNFHFPFAPREKATE